MGEKSYRCYIDMGIPIPKTLVIWVFPSHISFAIWVRVRVRVTGDAHITRVLGMRMPETRECPYHCDTGSFEKQGTQKQWACFQIPSWRQQTRLLFSHCAYILCFLQAIELDRGHGCLIFYHLFVKRKVRPVSVLCNVHVLHGNGSNGSVSLTPYFSC